MTVHTFFSLTLIFQVSKNTNNTLKERKISPLLIVPLINRMIGYL